MHQEYETTFGIQKWKDLSAEQKQKHTLEKCKACERRYCNLQITFPQGPHYDGEKIVSINIDELDSVGKKLGARKALHEINASFSDSIVRCGDSDLQKKETRTEQKKKIEEYSQKVSRSRK